MLSQLKHIFFRKRKGEPVKGLRLWLKRANRLFWGLLVAFLIASIAVSKAPHSSYSVPPSAASGSATSFNQVTPAIASPVPASTVVTPSGSMEGAGDAADGPVPPGYRVPAPAPAPTPTPTLAPVGCYETYPNTSNLYTNNWLLSSRNGLLGTTDPCSTFSNQAVVTAWTAVLGIAYVVWAFRAFLLVIQLGGGIFGFRPVEAEEMSQSVVSFFFAPLSLLFFGFLITINNGLDLTILQLAQQQKVSLPTDVNWLTALSQVISALGGILLKEVPILGGTITTPNLVTAVGDLGIGILNGLLALSLLIRLGILALLIIAGPACIAGGQRLMWTWLTAVIAITLAQAGQLLCYAFGLMALQPVLGAITNIPALGLPGLLVLQMAILWITLFVPGFMWRVIGNAMGQPSQGARAAIRQSWNEGTASVSDAMAAFQ